jgi:hypothetical protein
MEFFSNAGPNYLEYLTCDISLSTGNINSPVCPSLVDLHWFISGSLRINWMSFGFHQTTALYSLITCFSFLRSTLWWLFLSKNYYLTLTLFVRLHNLKFGQRLTQWWWKSKVLCKLFIPRPIVRFWKAIEFHQHYEFYSRFFATFTQFSAVPNKKGKVIEKGIENGE